MSEGRPLPSKSASPSLPPPRESQNRNREQVPSVTFKNSNRDANEGELSLYRRATHRALNLSLRLASGTKPSQLGFKSEL